MKLLYFSHIDSTNKYLRENYNSLNNFTIVYAGEQTQGHGRYNRVWESENNANLLCSILLKDLKNIDNINSLSLLTGAVIYKLLKKHKINNVKIKWPNDIYVNDKKICGILTESIFSGDKINAVIIGIGLNLNQKKFLNQNATSYVLETNDTVNIKKMLTQLVKIFHKEMIRYAHHKSNYIRVINANNYLLNKVAKIVIANKTQDAIILDINQDNSLNAIINNKKTKLITGEILIN